jgi:muconolactone delta-isomerase
MKFLVTGLPGTTSMPVERSADLLQASLVWLKEKLGDGTLDSTYNLFGGGGIGIVNAASHEEVLSLLLSYPLYPYFSWEVEPLLDFEAAYKAYINYYQQLSG